MTRPHIIVAGLARCGTTLTMHMLHAAGVPCIGEKPAFEVDETNHRAVDAVWLTRYPGHALKLLDPHEAPLPATVEAAVIWLDRDPREQAKSQIKFNAIMLPFLPPVDRAHRRRWAAGLVRDRIKALDSLSRWPTLALQFEALLGEPLNQARGIARFLARHGHDLDPDAMARQVRPRSAVCAPGFDIELELLAEAENCSREAEGCPR